MAAHSGNRLKMVHEVDPRDYWMEKIGDLAEFDLKLNRILVVVYQRVETSKKTIGSIIIPETSQTAKEDRYQSKCGLVVKMGSKVYAPAEGDAYKFDEKDKVRIGDWVCFRASDGQQITINGVLCRIFSETQIIARIPDPDYVF